MAVHLDIQTQFDDRSVRSTADDLQRYLKRSGDSAGKAWADGYASAASKVEKAMQKAADAVGTVSVAERKATEVRKASEAQAKKVANAEKELATLRSVDHPRAAALVAQAERNLETLLRQQERTTTQVIQTTERLNKARRDAGSSAKAAANEIVSANSGIEESSKRAGVGLLNLGGTLGALGRAAGPVGIAALVPAIGALGGIAAAAAGSVALLPGAVGAAASAFGTLKLATMGLDDAFKNMQDPEKFAESLRALAPSAQQMMLSIRNLMPELTKLQQATQDALFANMGPQLNQFVNTMLPTVQRATTGIASAMNQAMTGAMNQLMTPDSMASIQNIVGNITKAFQNLAPAAAPLTKALTDLVEVGSGFLPQIAAGATEAAKAFSQFISEAKSSGQLQQWLASGLDILRQMGPITLDVSKAFLSLAPIGERVMPLIADSMSLIAEILPPIAKLTAEISPLFFSWEGGIRAATVAVGAMMPALTLVANTIGTVADGLAYLTGDAESRARADMLQARINAIGSASGPFGGAGDPTLGGGANASRERRGLAPVSGIPGGPFALPSGGGDWWKQGGNTAPLNLPPALSASSYVDQLIANGQAARSGSGGSGSARNAEGLVPNAAALKQVLQQMFPGIEIGGYRANDPYPDHPSGEALDIMVGNNRLLGDQINRWLLQNAPAFGLQYDLWQQAQWDPSGEIRPMANRGSPTANHMDHVHARVSPGEAANGLYMPLGATPYQQGGVQDVAVQSFGTSAQSDLNGAMGGQLGNQLDQDFGISKGLPGLAENAVKFVGNLFFAPLLTALQALAGQNPNQGSGLLGMAASAGAFGPQYIPSGGSSALSGAAPAGTPIGPSEMGPAALQPPGGWSADWNAIAQKESGGNWGINTGNGYSGGLQFSPSSWQAAGGGQYAPSANLATPYQQAMTAENLLKMQGPGAWPNTFTPGSSGPGMYGAGMPTPGAGGGSGLMGMVGQPQGMAYPSAGGAGFQGVGGLPMAALSTAASAVPGLGAAAQVGMQLANRVIAYGGQVAGIGMSGLMETLSVGDNPMGSIGNSWIGKLAGGFAGARPALPNMAGQSVNAPQGGPQGAADAGAAKAGNTANITINNQGATPDQNGKDVAAHTAAMWAPAGRQ